MMIDVCVCVKVGECWGYNRFLSLERLKTFVADDQLKLHFAIRPTTFQTQVRDLKLYSSYIESRVPGMRERNIQRVDHISRFTLVG